MRPEVGNDSSGFGAAVVYCRACVGVSTAAVTARVLHTFGAVSRVAPNDCSDESGGHTCDDETDLMFPAIGGEPLSSSSSIRAGTTTTVTRAAGRIRRTLRGSCGSTARRRSRSRSPGPARCPPTCPGSCMQGELRRRGTRGSGWRSARLQVPAQLVPLEQRSACTVRPGACSASRRGRGHCGVRACIFRLSVAVTGKGSRAQLQSGDHVPATLLGGVPVVQSRRTDRDAGEGLEVRLVERRLPRRKKTCTVPMSAATSARARFVRA